MDHEVLSRLIPQGKEAVRPACKKCGYAGHLTYQCRNFIKIDPNKDIVLDISSTSSDSCNDYSTPLTTLRDQELHAKLKETKSSKSKKHKRKKQKSKKRSMSALESEDSDCISNHRKKKLKCGSSSDTDISEKRQKLKKNKKKKKKVSKKKN
uniref:Protein SREK1IP1 n=1 Tax=Clastoptera arizonana TaxID=38151 RepID=A0A1B6EEQ0_9HEMI